MFVVKTDSLGNTEWQKTYGGPIQDAAYNIVQRGNNYIICGVTSSFCLSGDSTDTDLWIVYTDSVGNVVDTLSPLVPRPPIVLAAATPLAPANKAVNVITTPTLTWAPLPQATSFDVQVSRDNSFDAPILDRLVVSNDSTIAPSLANGTTYYWRVRGKADTATGPWSAVWSFTVAPQVGVADDHNVSPAQPVLDEVYPNPFVDAASVAIRLPAVFDRASTSLRMYDVLGREIADLSGQLFSSSHNVTIQLRSGELTAGSYTLVLESAGTKTVRSVQVVK